MKNKIIALLMIVCLFIISVPAFAASEPYQMGYSAGPTTHSVTAASCIEVNGQAITGFSVYVPANGSAKYGFLLPFDSRSVTVKYSGANGKTIIDSGYKTYELSLSGSGEYVLEFGTHLGYDPQQYEITPGQGYILREFAEKLGEREFTITSTGGITIEELVFEKAKVTINTVGVPPLPDVEDAVLKTVDTVMMDTKSNIISVNGGRRYIDNNKTEIIPYNYEGAIFLPINTLAKALGYYYEDIPEKSYVLLRSDAFEYVLLGSEATIRRGSGAIEKASETAVIYRNGTTWAAVRYFAELLGETVGFKDGLVVIDDKYTVKDVLNDDDLYEFATDIFKPFKKTKAEGNTYYVAQTDAASDENNGSALAPFKTLAKAGSVAKAGDTVIIREGVYRETLTPLNDGTASSPITFKAAEDEHVVITAADPLGGFAHYKDNIYVSKMKWDLGLGRNQLFIGEEAMVEAKYPNGPDWRQEGMSDQWTERGDMYAALGPVGTIQSDTLLNQDEENYWQGATYVGVSSLGYVLSSGTVKSSKKGELTLENMSRNWWWPSDRAWNWNYGCVIGHINALDIEKEWVKQDDYVYMIFPNGFDPLSTTVEAKARQLVIDISDRKYINIEGITTVGGSAKMNNSEMCMLNGMNMKYISHFTLSNDQKDGYIDYPYDPSGKNGAPQRGEVGLYIGGTDNILVNSHLDHSAGAGIYGVGLYTYIENNVINDCGYMGSYVSGINFNTVKTDSKTKARGGYAIYNNTVYNCGRSCLNISIMEGDHSNAPYLPMEIAYNDFHDGILCTLDTGILYNYYDNLGLDKKKTELHHNFVYTTTTETDSNPFSMAIYHDGGSAGTETYNNLAFNTKEGTKYSHRPIYVQEYFGSQANQQVYNNSVKDAVGGLETMTAAHFPQGKRFYAGAGASAEDYQINYNNYLTNAKNEYKKAVDATISDGVILDEGIARFTADGQYVRFADVDFGDGSDTVNLTVYGDMYYSCDEIDVIIGSDMETGILTSAKVQVSTPDNKTPDNVNITVGYISGVHDVFVKVTDYRSLGIGYLNVSGLSETGKNDKAYATKVYGGNFTSYDNTEVIGNEGMIPTSTTQYASDHQNPYVNNTWSGTVLEYKDVTLRSNADRVAIAMGSGGEWAGQTVEIYMDSLDSEPVVCVKSEKTDWYDFTPVFTKLDREIPAGRHDFYIRFKEDAEDKSSKSSNFYFFGFITTGADEPIVTTDDDGFIKKVNGGDFNAAESVQNEEMPFVARHVKRGEYDRKGLTNTRPGTVAVYKGIKLNREAKSFAISYASENGFDGQKVSVRVGSAVSEPIAEFVTQGNGWETFNTETITLSSPLVAGTYDIYLTFGGENGSNQTCKLDWFGFEE